MIGSAALRALAGFSALFTGAAAGLAPGFAADFLAGPAAFAVADFEVRAAMVPSPGIGAAEAPEPLVITASHGS